jgi:hypothetical protein
MSRSVQLALAFILLAGWFTSLAAQSAEVSFQAYADARQVLTNSYFDVTYTLRNAEGDNFQPPAFTDFERIAGPSRSTSMSIINGEMTRETSFTFTLRPRRTGTLTISPASITVNGQVLRSNPLQVEVVEGRDNSGADEVFLEARLNSETAFVGQQLILDYVLYTQVQVDGWNPMRESEYQGAFAREVRRFDNRVVREVINGVQYASRILKRVVLYPQQSGELLIAPFEAQLGVVDPNAPRRSLLRPPVRRVIAATEPLQIQVQPLPQPAPDNFSGITGHYTLEVRPNRRELTTDDALSLLVSLRGEGDLKRVQPPPLDFPASFETYDPNVQREEYVDYADRIQGVKTFEYLVVPTKAGPYTLEPAIVVFDPDSVKYVTLRSDPIRLMVEQGSGQAADPTIVEAPQEDRLHPFLDRVRLNQARQDRLTGSLLYWLLLGLPFLGVGGMAFARRRQRRRAHIDPETLRRQQARAQALARLETARQHLDQGAHRAFFTEVERALLGYVGDKLQIPRSDMTKANVQARLEQLGTQPAQVQAFMDLLKTCEMALYAGQDSGEAMARAYAQAGELLSELEASLVV